MLWTSWEVAMGGVGFFFSACTWNTLRTASHFPPGLRCLTPRPWATWVREETDPSLLRERAIAEDEFFSLKETSLCSEEQCVGCWGVSSIVFEDWRGFSASLNLISRLPLCTVYPRCIAWGIFGWGVRFVVLTLNEAASASLHIGMCSGDVVCVYDRNASWSREIKQKNVVGFSNMNSNILILHQKSSWGI